MTRKVKIWKVVSSFSILFALIFSTLNIISSPDNAFAGSNDPTWTATMSCTAVGRELCRTGRARTVARMPSTASELNLGVSANWIWQPSGPDGWRNEVGLGFASSIGVGTAIADTGYITLTVQRLDGSHFNRSWAWRI